MHSKAIISIRQKATIEIAWCSSNTIEIAFPCIKNHSFPRIGKRRILGVPGTMHAALQTLLT